MAIFGKNINDQVLNALRFTISLTLKLQINTVFMLKTVSTNVIKYLLFIPR